MTDMPPGHRAGRSVVLVGVLLGLLGVAVLIVVTGAGAAAVDTGAAIMNWSWGFLWPF
jgi:hypothetical protein